MVLKPGQELIFPRRNITPVVFLFIDGKPAPDLERRLTSFSYKKSVKKASETKLTFINEPGQQLLVQKEWKDLGEDRRFLANTVWQFRFGYFTNLSPIHTGIIRQIEPTYAERREVSVVLFDHSSKLGKSSSAQNWGKVPSSEVARRIARKYGLEAVVEDSQDTPKRDWIQPGTVSDLQFLRDTAAQIHYEVFVHDSPPTLVYRSVQYDAEPVRTFVYRPGTGGIVKSFKPKIKSLGEIKTQASKAQGKKKDGGKGKGSEQRTNEKGTQQFGEIIGIPGQPAPNVQTYTHGDGAQRVEFVDVNSGDRVFIPTGYAATLADAVPGATIAYDGMVVGKDPVGQQEFFDNLARDHAKAKSAAHQANLRQIAATRRQQLLDKAQEASSDHPLLPDITIGAPYEWDGLDKPFNRKWYCTEVNHAINGTSSTTRITWKRDDPKRQNKNNKKAADKSSDKTKNQAKNATVEHIRPAQIESILPPKPVPTTKSASPAASTSRTSFQPPHHFGPKY